MPYRQQEAILTNQQRIQSAIVPDVRTFFGHNQQKQAQ